MIAVVIALIAISGVNLNLFLTYSQKISEYGNKAMRIEKALADKVMLEHRMQDEIGADESELIRQRSMAANRLIIKDIFPWSRVFEVLETKVPKGIIVHGILPSDDYRTLVLEGEATSERKITFFLKRLEEWDVLRNSILTEFSIDTDTDKTFRQENPAVNFSIKSDLVIENIFTQQRFRGVAKSVMAQPGKTN